MSEMVERVARALAPLAWAALGTGDTLAQKSRRAASLRHARTAIEALREPSDQMIDAVYKNEFIQAMRPEDLYAAWESMINTALGEKPR